MPFWDAVPTTSQRHSSMGSGIQPKLLTASTRYSLSKSSLITLERACRSLGYPCRSLIVRDQHSLDVRVGSQSITDGIGISSLSPLHAHLGHISPVGLGIVGEPIAEGADADRQHHVSRRESVDDGGLQASCARCRKHKYVFLSPEYLLQLLTDAKAKVAELGPTVIYHRPGESLKHLFRARCGSWCPQVVSG